VRCHSVGNDDVMCVLMKCNTIPVVLSASRKASKKIRLFYIEDEDFTIEGDFMSQEVTIHRKPGQYRIDAQRYVQENIIEKVVVGKVEPLKQELETFIDCVKKQRPFPITRRNRQSGTLSSVKKSVLHVNAGGTYTNDFGDVIPQTGPPQKDRRDRYGVCRYPGRALFADSPAFERVYGFQRESPTSVTRSRC